MWDADLSKIPGFEQEVTEKLQVMINDGLLVALQTKKALQLK
jgi:hypothetical protein